MGGQGHPHGLFVARDPNDYIVAFPVEPPDLDLRRVILVEFIFIITLPDAYPEGTIILIAGCRGNGAVSVQIPNVLMFPVARRILDGIRSAFVRSNDSACIITLHQGLADIQIDILYSLRPIYPLRHLCTFVAVHNRLPFPVCRQHKGILQLYRG